MSALDYRDRLQLAIDTVEPGYSGAEAEYVFASNGWAYTRAECRELLRKVDAALGERDIPDDLDADDFEFDADATWT